MSTDSSCHNLFGKVGKSLKNLELNLGLSSNSLVSRLGVLLGLGGQRLDGLGEKSSAWKASMELTDSSESG